MIYLSKSIEDTYVLAEKIAKQLTGGEIVLLNGELGAGKTTFTKGLAKALGVTESVVSPTFMIMCEYVGRLPLYHFDMYRIEEEDELEELGLTDYLYENGVCVIEWNKFTHLPKDKLLTINISSIDETTRRYEVL